jgi:predicted SprT family Zn-dependent metalloprotease
MKPTKDQFVALQNAYDFFNKRLFHGKLNSCLLNFSRKSKAYGFFAPERWGERRKKKIHIHEISLNPETLMREPKDTFATLVHEMCHLWQFDHGTYSKNGYHNQEWATKMKDVGLIPSDTAAPGGKETGSRVSHYIEKHGRFEKVFSDIPEKILLPLVCVAEVKKEAKKNKVKYTCAGCDSNVWGKAGLNISCEDCEESFTEN